VGLELGRQWVAQGVDVSGVRRSEAGAAELLESGIRVVVGDVTAPESMTKWGRDWDVVVNAVSSSRGGVDVYRQVYGVGTRNLVGWMREAGVGRYVHLSSTSVYGQTDGGWVTEASPADPLPETGQVLAATERWILGGAASGVAPTILRVAGIYGPGRGYALQQLLKGEARIQGDGTRWVNMVHRDDVASAIRAVAGASVKAVGGKVFNVVDDEPVRQGEFVTWLAREHGLPVPPVATEEENAARKRGLTNKRVDNRRLRESTGWVPQYRSFREGYARVSGSRSG
jgi:nucleoside-diphosphate-sugar epimerase